MADTLDTLLNDIQMGYTTNLIPMLDNISSEKIIEQLGPGGYDELFNAALDSGNADMVKLLLRRSNLITIPLESVVSDELSETGKKAYNVSPDVKKELQNFIRSVNRSNLQDYKGKPKEWKKELEEARKNGYNDLADRLENRMKFEENRRLENDGKRPEGTSENRWFMDENAWVMDGFGRMEFDMYGQKNAQAIMDELQANGIRVDDYSAYIKNEKTGDLNDYRIRVNENDVKKLHEFLDRKRQEQKELEDVIAITTPDDEKEEDLEKDEALTKADAIPASKTEDGITPGIPPKVTPAFARRTVNVEETRVEPQPKTELKTKTQEQGENKMSEKNSNTVKTIAATKEFFELDWKDLTDERIQDLATRGADFNAQDLKGRIKLFQGIKDSSNLKAIESLLQNGADVNIQDSDGRTLVFYATLYNNYEMAQMLADNGANFLLQTKDHASPWDLVADGDTNPKLRDLVLRITKEQKEAIEQEKSLSDVIEEETNDDDLPEVEGAEQHSTTTEATSERQTLDDLLTALDTRYRNPKLKASKDFVKGIIDAHPEMINAMLNVKDMHGKTLMSSDDIIDFIHHSADIIDYDKKYAERVIAILANPEEVNIISNYSARGYGLLRAYEEPLDSTIKQNPGLFTENNQENDKIQTTSKKKTTFRDLNKLDAHMSRSEVLARLEDVELPKNDNGQKALLDEIKRQYASDKPIKGLNGRINSTDMLRFAQHIDNVIDDGEPDNIDYTQGRDVMIRSLATLDRHLQISEVLARLEDVASKTQDPNEQALLDLVREGYESKRLHPENDLSGLDSFVDSTAAVNLAERIDLAIDDGEIENVKCHINDVIDVNEPKGKEKDVVQPKKTKLGMNKSQWIKIDRDTIPPTPSKTDDDLPPAEGEEHPEEYQEEETFDPPAEEEEMNPPEGGKRVNVNVRLPKRMDPTPGIKGNWEFGPNWFSHMRVAKDSFRHLRPCYFNPKDLSPEERKLALLMLEKRGIKPVIQPAERDMGKSRNPIHKHDEVWVVGAEYDESGRKISHKERADQIKKLRNFWDACVRDESKKMAYGLDLQQPEAEAGLDDDLPEVAGKGGKPAKKAKRDWDEGARGEAVKFIKEQGKDIGLAAVDALDKFGAAFTAASGDPEMLGCEMLCAMLVLPWDFIASYVKNKAEKVDLSIPPKGKQKDSFTNTNTDDKLRQAKALHEFMLKMMQKDPKLFGEMGRKGILPDTQKGEYGENLKAIKEAFAKDPALFGRLKVCFGQTAAENPELFLNCIPADYKGPVTPDALLNHIMGWGKDGVQQQDKTIAQPQEQVQPVVQPQVQPVVQPQTQPNSEMAQMMAVMQEMNAKLSSMQAEIQQLRAENAALRADNEQLRAQVQALQAGKTQPGNVAQPVQPTTQVEQPKMEERDIPDLTKLGALNNLNPTMAKNIMDEEVPGFKETGSMTPEQLAQNPKAKFFDAVRQAYSTGNVTSVKDLVQTDQQAQWAEKLAHAVDNNNGNNVPRIKKNIALTGAEKPVEQKPEAEKKDPRQLAEEALKNPPKTPEEGNKVILQIVLQLDGKVSEKTEKEIARRAKQVVEEVVQLKEKEIVLSKSQMRLAQEKGKEIKNLFELNKDGEVVKKGGSGASWDDNETIRMYMEYDKKYVTKNNIKTILEYGQKNGWDFIAKNPEQFDKRQKTTSAKTGGKAPEQKAGKNNTTKNKEKSVDLSSLQEKFNNRRGG